MVDWICEPAASWREIVGKDNFSLEVLNNVPTMGHLQGKLFAIDEKSGNTLTDMDIQACLGKRGDRRAAMPDLVFLWKPPGRRYGWCW
ncbi:hypothetical protein NONI108955_41845 [Nocardia ninae]|uniref:Uncharacterized protein n=1 Tax=Nocardia ninae NBRC 108245 TaxID=1210091 RepID=A0A511MU38_9NOCA|nr:hypothetical protein [Nocardia ninae]GEM43738.1 hypothetical protein NN4_82570 [Nocardia ninae NBRC 108245]